MNKPNTDDSGSDRSEGGAEHDDILPDEAPIAIEEPVEDGDADGQPI